MVCRQHAHVCRFVSVFKKNFGRNVINFDDFFRESVTRKL